MPGKPKKPHRIRVRTLDGKPVAKDVLNKVKPVLGTWFHFQPFDGDRQFVLCADTAAQVEALRPKLASAGFEEIVGGDTMIPSSDTPAPPRPQPRHEALHLHGAAGQPGWRAPPVTNAQPLPGKPYGFVSLPKDFNTAAPIWHDGDREPTEVRLSGEIRFELKTLTPLLVGWERLTLSESEGAWVVPLRRVNRNECAEFVQAAARDAYPDATDPDDSKRQRMQQKIDGDRRRYTNRVQDNIVDVRSKNAGWCIDAKPVLSPLRAPWGKRPVIIPGDSLKGLLRHELGALLGAPMERVAERSYSYRPNALFTRDAGPQLIARIARVPNHGTEMKTLEGDTLVRVPTKLELFPTNLRYDKWHEQSANYYRFDDGSGGKYRGGQGAGQPLNSKRSLHSRLTTSPSAPTQTVTVSGSVQEGYLATVRHLVDLDHGHFSERHPDVPKAVTGKAAQTRILKAAADEVFQPGDYIWVEWDTVNKCIVSLGWHYYYRWAYTDTVRRDADAPRLERHGLFPIDEERKLDGTERDKHRAPMGLSAVRRLFGYTGDNEGSKGIGAGDHSQLMGRVFVNAGLEVVSDNESENARFLKPTFLKELGMPRPSAVEHYLKQPHHPHPRPSDKATLVTYGDAAGYDAPGELAGRKFYLDRSNAVADDPSAANRLNDRSTLALEASKPGRKFRFTVRFRDLEPAELAAILVALSPEQFKGLLGGTHPDGYCSKLGYARPLGWGSVRIEAKALLLLDERGDAPKLQPEDNLVEWVTKSHEKTATEDEWLAIHRRNHPDAADYPRKDDQIYTFHTSLRAEHSRLRRYRNGGHG